MKKAMGAKEAYLSNDPDVVVDAVKVAMAELKLEVTSATASKVDGEVRGLTAQGKDISVKVKSDGPNVSKMTVHVGTMGDKSISEAIIDATRKHLSQRKS